MIAACHTGARDPRAHAPPRRLWLCLWLTALAWLAAAQPAAAETLTEALANKRLESLRTQGVDESSEMYQTYAEVASLLAQAVTFERDAKKQIDSLRESPARQAKIEQRVSALQTQATTAPDYSKLHRSELTAQLLTSRAELEEHAADLAQLDRTLAGRSSSASTIRERLAAIRDRLDQLPDSDSTVDAQAAASLTEALDWHAGAERNALKAERRKLEARLASQPFRYSVYTAQRAELALQVDRLQATVRALETTLEDKVLAKSDAAAVELKPESLALQVADGLLAQDKALRAESLAAAGHLAAVRTELAAIQRLTRVVEEHYDTAQRLVKFAADSDSLGNLLLAHWQEIETYRGRINDDFLSKPAADTAIRRIEHEEALKALSDVPAFVTALMDDAGISPDQLNAQEKRALREVVLNHRSMLQATVDTQSDYLAALNELSDNRATLAQLVREYSDFLTGLILWIPDFPKLWQADFSQLPQEATLLLGELRSTRLEVTGPLVLALLASSLLLLTRRRLRAELDWLNARVGRPRDDSALYSLAAVLCCLLLALPAPVLLAGLSGATTGSAVAGAVLRNLAAGLLVFHFIRLVCARGGVAARHFEWSEQTVKRIRRDTHWVLFYWLPLLTVINWLVIATPSDGQAIIARGAALLVAIPALVVLLYQLYREGRSADGHWLDDRLQQLRALLALALVGTVIAVTFGHVHSLSIIYRCLFHSLWLGVVLAVVRGLLMRWIAVTRRRARFAELREAQAGVDKSADALKDESKATLVDVSEDSRALVNVSVAAAGIAALVAVWSRLLPAFDAFSSITLWTSVSEVDGQAVESRITVTTVLVVLLLAGLTLYAARKLPALIDLVLRSRTGVSPSARYTVSTLLNYIIIGGGIVIAFGALGLRWSQLQWLVAAMGVGIGFGLQEIIANFISGLIILFERPIRVGDVVSTGTDEGVVTRIRIRATTIVDWDGRELLVPNKEFITGRLLNWSLSDPKIRVVLPVGIAYGSNVDEALRILHDVVRSHPRVVDDPAPSIIFQGFGDSTLNLVARCFLDSMDGRLDVMTQMNTTIYRRFEEAGIVIAFPQRDLHFGPESTLRVALTTADKPAKPDA